MLLMYRHINLLLHFHMLHHRYRYMFVYRHRHMLDHRYLFNDLHFFHYRHMNRNVNFGDVVMVDCVDFVGHVDGNVFVAVEEKHVVN